MTIDEAIRHCGKVAEEQEELYRICPASESEMFHCNGTKDCRVLKNGKNKGCKKCAEEHRQLAEWLEELKDYRDKNKMVVRVDVENMDSIKDKIEELSKYAEIQYEKAIDDFLKIAYEELLYSEHLTEVDIDYIAEQLKAGANNGTDNQ